jgi:aryl-alcohol dehydrogenase-like predicted oxidoreductase
MNFLHASLLDPKKNAAVGQLDTLATELGISVAQLALAWTAKNPRVSSVITGASRLAQLQSNLGALAVIDRLTPEVLMRVDALTADLAE